MEEMEFSLDPLSTGISSPLSNRRRRRPRLASSYRQSAESSRNSSQRGSRNSANSRSSNSNSSLTSTQRSIISSRNRTFGESLSSSSSSISRIRKIRTFSPLSSNSRQRLSNHSSITSNRSWDDERSSIEKSLESSRVSSSPSSNSFRGSRLSHLHQYSLSSIDEQQDDSKSQISIHGTDMNVLAVQDAGSYRIILDDFTYLLSSAQSETSSISEAALWELAYLLSRKQHRSILWSCTSDAALSSILNLLGNIPEDLRKRKLTNDVNPNIDETMNCRTWTEMRYEALATIIHFLSLDCTTSSPSANASNTSNARMFRHSILQHSKALLGMSHMTLLSVLNSFIHENRHEPHQQKLFVSKFPSPRCSVSSKSEMMFSSSENTENTYNRNPLKSKDPTMIGRRNRRRLRQITQATQSSDNEYEFKSVSSGDDYDKNLKDFNESSQESDERLSFPSVEQNLNRPPDMNQEKLLSKIHELKHKVFMVGATIHSADEGTSLNLVSVPYLTLESLLRIIQGKNEGDETSCLDGEDESDVKHLEDFSNDMNQDLEAGNPIVMTNKALFQSGSLEILAMGMAEILDLASCSFSISRTKVKHISMLATLIDSACLLSVENRDELCSSTTFAIRLLKFLSIAIRDDNSNVLEIILSCMRMLTSLTHESKIACDMLLRLNDMDGNFSKQTKMCGIEIIIQLLFYNSQYGMKETAQNTEKFRQAYDINIFCLNTLTNVVETARSPRFLIGLQVPSQATFLSWFVSWIVKETEPFRKQAMAGKFEKSISSLPVLHNHEQSCLPEEADENLVTAGNGFILLACILVHGNDALRESIISELGSEGFTLMIHTLKSFCNFYYFSLGDLSVAVISPVKKLLEELEPLGRSESTN
jgi:hypothetical protein